MRPESPFQTLTSMKLDDQGLPIVKRWGLFRRRRPKVVWQGESSWLGSSTLSFLVGLTSIPVLGWLDTVPEVTLPGRAWALLGLAGLSQAMPLEVLLSLGTVEERAARPWVRILRFVLMAVPLYGFLAVPAWNWLARRKPVWAFGRAPESSLSIGPRQAPFLLAANRLATIPRRFFASPWGAVGLLLFEMVVLWAATPVLAAPWGRQDLGRALSAVLHVVSAASMATYFILQARGAGYSRGRMLLATLPALFWVPRVPWLPFAGVLVYLFTGLSRRETLVGDAHDSRSAASPGWRDHLSRQGEAWGEAPLRIRIGGPPAELVPTPAREGDLARHWTAFSRGRCLFLPLEAGWLAWMGRRLAVRFAAGAATGAVLDTVAAIALLLGSAALAGMAVLFLRRLVGRRGPELEVRLLAFSQLGLGLGLLLGRAVFGREPALLTGVTVIGGLLSIFVLVPPIFLSLLRTVPEVREEDPREQYLWLLLGPLLLLASLRFASGEDLSRDWLLVAALLAVAPLLGLLPGLLHLRWLLRPLTPREILLPGLPLRDRLGLAFLLAGGLLPLGGLTLPVWAVLRRWHWPESMGGSAA